MFDPYLLLIFQNLDYLISYIVFYASLHQESHLLIHYLEIYHFYKNLLNVKTGGTNI